MFQASSRHPLGRTRAQQPPRTPLLSEVVLQGHVFRSGLIQVHATGQCIHGSRQANPQARQRGSSHQQPVPAEELCWQASRKHALAVAAIKRSRSDRPKERESTAARRQFNSPGLESKSRHPKNQLIPGRGTTGDNPSVARRTGHGTRSISQMAASRKPP